MNNKITRFMHNLANNPFAAQRFKSDPDARANMMAEAGLDAEQSEALESRDEGRIAKALGINGAVAFMLVVVVLPNGTF